MWWSPDGHGSGHETARFRLTAALGLPGRSATKRRAAKGRGELSLAEGGARPRGTWRAPAAMAAFPGASFLALGRLQFDDLRDGVHGHPDQGAAEALLGEAVGPFLHLAPDQERPPAQSANLGLLQGERHVVLRRNEQRPSREARTGLGLPADLHGGRQQALARQEKQTDRRQCKDETSCHVLSSWKDPRKANHP